MSSTDSPASHTRRQILGLGGVGVLGGIACYLGWPKGESLQKVAKSAISKSTEAPLAVAVSPDLAKLSGIPGHEDFLAHLNSEFHLESVGKSCKLVEVSPLQKMTAPAGEFVSFSLVFKTANDFVAESQIHQLSHSQLGKLDLFISQIGRPKDHLYLEAVCSQRV